MTQIFVSHSSKDKEVRDFFGTIFGSTNVRAVFKEVEGFKTNFQSEEIKNDIRKSSAFFILLGENAQSLKYTRDWIIWESGIAKSFGKEIWLFEPLNSYGKIDIIIPELNHYVVYGDSNDFTRYIRNIINSYDESKILPSAMVGGAVGFLGGLILETIISKENNMTGWGGAVGSLIGGSVGLLYGDKSHTKPIGITIQCVKCLNSYQIHMRIPVIRCPICNAKLMINWEKFNNQNSAILIKVFQPPDVQEGPIQGDFTKLKQLIIKLYKSKTKSSLNFALQVRKFEEWQDLFGFAVNNKEPIDDQYHYFLDGKYYVIPNSATLRKENEKGNYETILSKDDPHEKIVLELNNFFNEIKKYVKTEHNYKLK